MSRINLMWPEVAVKALNNGNNEIRIKGHRKRRDGEAGAEVTIVIEDCGWGVAELLKEFAAAENAHLKRAKGTHANSRRRLGDAWREMGDQDE